MPGRRHRRGWCLPEKGRGPRRRHRRGWCLPEKRRGPRRRHGRWGDGHPGPGGRAEVGFALVVLREVHDREVEHRLGAARGPGRGHLRLGRGRHAEPGHAGRTGGGHLRLRRGRDANGWLCGCARRRTHPPEGGRGGHGGRGRRCGHRGADESRGRRRRSGARRGLDPGDRTAVVARNGALDLAGGADEGLNAQAGLLHHDLDGPHVEGVGHRDVQMLTRLAALDLDGEQQVLDADVATQQLQSPRVRLGLVDGDDGPVQRLADRRQHREFVDAATRNEQLTEIASHGVLLAHHAVEHAPLEHAGAHQDLAESEFVAHGRAPQGPAILSPARTGCANIVFHRGSTGMPRGAGMVNASGGGETLSV
jgi:hypothetical protein